MTCMTKIVADVTLNDAMMQASTRAMYSYFDQHIIRTDDGCCWVADEGSYETLMADLGDRIIATVPAGRSDES